MSAPLPMRDILETMFRGWILHEASYEHRTQSTIEAIRSPEDAMAEACGGDRLAGELLCLFGHWTNDVTSIAAHYGLALARRQPDGTLLHDDCAVDTLMRGGVLEIVNIAPPPTPEHFWHAGAWTLPEPEQCDKPEAMV